MAESCDSWCNILPFGIPVKICYICINHVYFKFRTRFLIILINMIESDDGKFAVIPIDRIMYIESHYCTTIVKLSNCFQATGRKFCVMLITNY